MGPSLHEPVSVDPRPGGGCGRDRELPWGQPVMTGWMLTHLPAVSGCHAFHDPHLTYMITLFLSAM